MCIKMSDFLYVVTKYVLLIGGIIICSLVLLVLLVIVLSFLLYPIQNSERPIVVAMPLISSSLSSLISQLYPKPQVWPLSSRMNSQLSDYPRFQTQRSYHQQKTYWSLR